MGIINLKRELGKGFLYLEFVKKNGDLRKMWCTRDNRIIRLSGHSEIAFNQSDIVSRERRLPHLIYVYDLQEKDTRMVNINTVLWEVIKVYSDLGEVDIPMIETRFEKDNKRKLAEEKEKGLGIEFDLVNDKNDIEKLFS